MQGHSEIYGTGLKSLGSASGTDKTHDTQKKWARDPKLHKREVEKVRYVYQKGYIESGRFTILNYLFLSYQSRKHRYTHDI